MRPERSTKGHNLFTRGILLFRHFHINSSLTLSLARRKLSQLKRYCVTTMPPSRSFQLPVVLEDYETIRNGLVTRRLSSKTKLSSLDSFPETLNADASAKRRRPRQRRVTAIRTANAIVWSAIIYYFVIQRYSHSDDFEQFHKEPLAAPHSSIEILKNDTSALDNQQPEEVDSDFVHIIHTRFMQHQPHLIHLGLARLELMKSFTIESLVQQTSQNFLWVIRTDPNLNATLKEPILDFLKDYERHLLIADTENPNVQIHELRDLDAASVWSGDVERAKQYLNSKQKVIETRVDADDALAYDFVERVQARSTDVFTSDKPSWRIWCTTRHLDWQYHSVFDDEHEHDDEGTRGSLISLRQSGCLATGLSIGYTEGVIHSDLPPIKHDQLAKTTKHCRNKEEFECIEGINLKAGVLRARTPTSAGMLNLLFQQKGMANENYEKGAMTQKVFQDTLWAMSEAMFGYTEERATLLHKYINSNLRLIAIDNLRGQCTEGHSCKDSSKTLLQTIIDHPELI